MNKDKAVKFLAIYAMEWDNERIIGGIFDPFNNIADAFMVEDAIAKMDKSPSRMGKKHQMKYVQELCNLLPSVTMFSCEVENEDIFAIVHASPRQRTLATVRALATKEQLKEMEL